MKRTTKAKKENPVIRNGMVLPKYVDTVADLAALLHEQFKGQLSIAINGTQIGQWRKGVGLGEVAVDGQMVRPPPFPSRGTNRHYQVMESVEWVKQWIVPQKAVGINGNGHVKSGTAEEFETKKKEQELWRWRRERDISDGEYASRAVFNQHLIALGLTINQAVNLGEKQMQRTIVSAVKAQAPTEALLPLISQAIADGVRAAADGMRSTIVKALGECKETKTKGKR